MKALSFASHGTPSNLTWGEWPDPVPGPGQVLVRVRAAALNHLDLFVLHGLPGLPPSLPHVGGADASGVVEALGSGVGEWKVGDEVVINAGLSCGACEFCRREEESLCVHFGLLGEHVPGTFGELVAVPAANLARRPSHLSWEQAAAFPLTFLTAWRMLVTRGRLQEGETVLIHGIGGGVALAALVIAKRLGAKVFVTSSSDRKLRRATEMGADVAIDYSEGSVAKETRELTGKRGVDLVVDSVGKATWMTSLRSCARGGRIVTCGATTGPNPEEEIRLVFWNQLSILGSTMGSRRDWREMVKAVEAWHLEPVVDRVFPMPEGRAAYEHLAGENQFGKIVLVA
jgi:NADPH:quinone reductase-like Zn-dependent oxidoreductase